MGKQPLLDQNRVNELAALFNAAFLRSENTILCGGAEEPVYLPATNKHPHHRIYFTRDYFRSALHEIAHWCVAGKVRRQLSDYGYWYYPDGRDQQQQLAFEAVEAKPQSYEWLLSLSAGQPFEVSLDNLSGSFEPDRFAFTQRVINEAQQLLKPSGRGLPPRLAYFCEQLQAHYQQQPLSQQLLVKEGLKLLHAIEPKQADSFLEEQQQCNVFASV